MKRSSTYCGIIKFENTNIAEPSEPEPGNFRKETLT